MEQNRTIVHVATGSRDWERAAVEALAGVATVRRFDEPYSVVVFMSRSRTSTPVAVLIGLDELDSDERRLVAYARQTWPDAPILVYGSRLDSTGFPREATTIVSDPRKLASAMRVILGGTGGDLTQGNGPVPGALSNQIGDPRRRTSRDSAILSTEELASLLGNRDL